MPLGVSFSAFEDILLSVSSVLYLILRTEPGDEVREYVGDGRDISLPRLIKVNAILFVLEDGLSQSLLEAVPLRSVNHFFRELLDESLCHADRSVPGCSLPSGAVQLHCRIIRKAAHMPEPLPVDALGKR